MLRKRFKGALKKYRLAKNIAYSLKLLNIPFSAYKSAISCDSFFLLEDKKISSFQTTIGIISEIFLKKWDLIEENCWKMKTKTFCGNGDNFAKSKNVHRPPVPKMKLFSREIF
jgi:hypothetical protein